MNRQRSKRVNIPKSRRGGEEVAGRGRRGNFGLDGRKGTQNGEAIDKSFFAL